MSARVKIKRYFDDDVKVVPFSSPRDGIIIECEQDNPPSAKGRTVYLYLTEDDRDALLKVLRSEAIRARV